MIGRGNGFRGDISGGFKSVCGYGFRSRCGYREFVYRS